MRLVGVGASRSFYSVDKDMVAVDKIAVLDGSGHFVGRGSAVFIYKVRGGN